MTQRRRRRRGGGRQRLLLGLRVTPALAILSSLETPLVPVRPEYLVHRRWWCIGLCQLPLPSRGNLCKKPCRVVVKDVSAIRVVRLENQATSTGPNRLEAWSSLEAAAAVVVTVTETLSTAGTKCRPMASSSSAAAAVAVAAAVLSTAAEMSLKAARSAQPQMSQAQRPMRT